MECNKCPIEITCKELYAISDAEMGIETKDFLCPLEEYARKCIIKDP